MEYTSSQITHLLPFPYEITDLINSFCFEDKIIANVKRLKRIIYYKFKKGRCTHRNDDVSWAIWLQNSKQVEKQFQAWHCKRCGDYEGEEYTNKIKCKC